MTSNELRTEIGMKPSDSSSAETLRNPNLNQSNAEVDAAENGVDVQSLENEEEGGKPNV